MEKLEFISLPSKIRTAVNTNFEIISSLMLYQAFHIIIPFSDFAFFRKR
jgi:hypothetical protein